LKTPAAGLQPHISVVIPAYNAASTIRDCLQALTYQSAPPETYEIIVVDDASVDFTPSIVQSFPYVQLLLQEHKGPAAARNLGAAEARGEILLFTDADCAPISSWVEAMAAPFAEPQIAGVKGAYVSRQASLVARFVQAEYEDKYDYMAQEQYIDFIDTYSAGYRRDIYLDHGGFDTTFPTSCVEDQEFSFRLAAAGHKMVFCPQARVYHLRHAANLKTYFLKKFKIGYWKVLVHRRHPSKLVRDSHTPQSLKLQILLTAFMMLALLLGAVSPYSFWLAVAAGLAFLLTTFPFVRKTWAKDRAVALVAPVLLFARALALGVGFASGLAAAFLVKR
jgi:glycosyltransferase involved in cell wall biosynthesis